MKPTILLSGGKGSLENYERAIECSGGTPLSFYCPPLDTGCDGLLLCGGDDIDPVHFHQENRGSQGIDPTRDAAELALAYAYISAGKPILGICRGCQVLNVALGGSLIQDLPANLRPFHISAAGQDGVHPVRAAEDSFFARTYGSVFSVNSSHHQAVDTPGEGLYPVLWSEGGVTEALAHEHLPILCVQFHPERMSFARSRTDTADGAPIFRWFLERCTGALHER